MTTVAHIASCRLAITNERDISYAQHESLLFTGQLGFCRFDAYTIATAVSELVSNVVRHAECGTLILQVHQRNDAVGVEIITEDEGPGIPSIPQALQEGFSTSKSLGCGLPGVQRLMDVLEIESVVGHGTRVSACKWVPLARLLPPFSLNARNANRLHEKC